MKTTRMKVNKISGHKEWCICGCCKIEIRETDCSCCQEVAAISENKALKKINVLQCQSSCLEKRVLKNVLVGLHEAKRDLL